jgi:hypothetical protein
MKPTFNLFFVLSRYTLGTVTSSMLDEEENVDAVRQLTEQFDEVRLY